MKAFVKLTTILLTMHLGIHCAAARATTVESWALCNNCSTQTQFENAAVAWVGNRLGTFEVEIGNVNTSKVYRVSVTNNQYPSNPTGTDEGVSVQNVEGYIVLGVPVETPKAVVDGDSTPSAYATVNYSMQEPQAVQDQFAAVVMTHGKQPIIAPGPKNAGFDSFAERLQPAVCALGNNAMGALNPAWQAGEIGPASMGNLMSVLAYYFGRGPTVHVVFNNGDVASFQLNPLVTSGCRYLEGTAKDRDGNPLQEANGIPNNNGGVTVTPHPGSNQVSYTTGSHWLVCSFVGGELIGCYVEFVPG
ncbi:hypothetical protein [Pseudoxanthomonas sp. X-1]|uniref:hypothetical protein n=1 Tax=Pseudoxanthomonas sp. X-1 TaxID=2571115 RepID=UPI00110A9AFC|nr:hypothetical protein [Pseudoxanthomonas sp. X-1]TMN24188.1 hypothetical protein FF950_06620 [Pseudoxanthomonas sp. X-1]UAY75151.1 hypothetical protein LAJ50_02480 [Pseudoxanthomonas sp. X-1]